MFDNVTDQNKPSDPEVQARRLVPPNIKTPQVPKQAEDIFSETLGESNEGAPLESLDQDKQTIITNPSLEQENLEKQSKKKLLILLSIFVGVIIVGYGTYFIFDLIVKRINQFKENSGPISQEEAMPLPSEAVRDLPAEDVQSTDNSSIPDKQIAETDQTEADDATDETVPENSNLGDTLVPELPVIATSTPVDTDRDGLADTEEKDLGTSPINIDSDNDGLNDFDEVKLYKTDPLKLDTDGDGFNDGEEVKAGYNPKGEGRLNI